MADPGDAVQLGLVASLARPGANITSLAPELATKRLELLKEAFPKTARVAVLWNSAIPPADRPGSRRHSRPSCENAAMRCSYFRIL
jgi:hypothetical protein